MRAARRGGAVLVLLCLATTAFGLVHMPRAGLSSASAAPGDPHQQAAWNWLQGQLRPPPLPASAASIAPTTTYATDWVGPVSGEFTPPAAGEFIAARSGPIAGLEVRAYVTTDTRYLIGVTAANSDRSFHFDASRPGAKSFELVDSGTGTVLAQWVAPTGLVRSFDVAVGEPGYGLTYTYDQALTLLCALSMHDRAAARTAVNGLLSLQTSSGPQSGGFVAQAATLNPAAAVPQYRTGIHSIATYALLRYLAALPAGDADRSRIRLAAERAVSWLRAQQSATGPMAGLLTGGYGSYPSDGGRFDPSVAITWSSTEHDLDSWHTLVLAASILGDPAAQVAADRLQQAILARLWIPSEGRFQQGWTVAGADPTDALDANAWGAIFLQASSRHDLAVQALAHTAAFASVESDRNGFAPTLRPATDGRAPIVWFEGSAGVALAATRVGDPILARTVLDELAQAQQGSGAVPYASRSDPGESMTGAPAVAATAWYLLASRAQQLTESLWGE